MTVMRRGRRIEQFPAKAGRAAKSIGVEQLIGISEWTLIAPDSEPLGRSPMRVTFSRSEVRKWKLQISFVT